ncbi:unnamed protein product, partial [Didymodactylos carnosus]
MELPTSRERLIILRKKLDLIAFSTYSYEIGIERYSFLFRFLERRRYRLGGYICNNGPRGVEVAPQLGNIETLNQLIKQANQMNIKTIIEIQLPLLQSSGIDDQYEGLLNAELISWTQLSSLFGIIIQHLPIHSLFHSSRHGTRLAQLIRSRFSNQRIITEFFATGSDYIARHLPL